MSDPQHFHDRIWPNVEFIEGGCWLWRGPLDKEGYPRHITYNRRTYFLLRWLWEQAYWIIPKGYEPDHLCRVRACINLDHAEVVTKRENILRGQGRMAKQARQTHCIHGHSLEDAYRWRTHRACRPCGLLAVKRYQENQR